MRFTFYDYLEYGNRYICDVCGVGILSMEELVAPVLCKRCKRAKTQQAIQSKAETQRKTNKRVPLSDEEKRIRKNESNKKYKTKHREQINQYVHDRKQNDPVYKLKCQARNTVYQSFARTGNVKPKRCEDITGLSQDDLISYLNNTYEKNYGKSWDGKEPVHVDHIIPLATAETEEDVIRLCHYTNLQLLTAKDNILKGDKLYANC